MNLLLFPNNLYEMKYLPNNIKKVFLIEDPVFFGYRDIKMKFNKIKLVLHRASMKYFVDYLIANNIQVKYIDLLKVKNYSFLKTINNIAYFELNDHFLQIKLDKYLKNKDIVILNNPNFFMGTVPKFLFIFFS